jgi:hypothetical protein
MAAADIIFYIEDYFKIIHVSQSNFGGEYLQPLEPSRTRCDQELHNGDAD